MNKRFLIILIGFAIVLVAISGYAGSNTAQQVNSNPGTSGTEAQTPAQHALNDNGFVVQGSLTYHIPSGQPTLENAIGHSNRQ